LGILFVNRSLIASMSTRKGRNVQFPKASCHHSNRKTRKRSHCLIENWRAISQVNVDTKIISKVIASVIRMLYWPYIIHSNHTGYVKDRYFSETVRSILDITDFTGLMIWIDFCKAFDALEWNFLFSCLDAFNFGHEFKLWISTFL